MLVHQKRKKKVFKRKRRAGNKSIEQQQVHYTNPLRRLAELQHARKTAARRRYSRKKRAAEIGFYTDTEEGKELLLETTTAIEIVYSDIAANEMNGETTNFENLTWPPAGGHLEYFPGLL